MFKTLLCAIAVLAGAAGRCPGLSEPADPHDRALPARRQRGHHGAAHRRAARARARRQDRDRQPQRRLRQHRHGSRGARQARRLHHRAEHHPARHQPGAVRQVILGSGQGLRADRHGGDRAARAGGSGQGEGDHGRGADEDGARQSRQAELRLGRRRHHLPSLRRDVQGLDQHLHPARALSRRRPGAARHARRPGGHELPDAVGGAAAREGRHAARACRHRYDALRAAARSAHHAAGRREGLPVHPVARAARARRHAARRRRARERRAARGAAPPRR